MFPRPGERHPSVGRPFVPPVTAAAMVLLITVCLLLVARPAQASATTIDTRLDFDVFGLIYSDGAYDYVFGAIVAVPLRHYPACTARRTVHFYEVEAGPDKLLGTDRANFFGYAEVVWHHPDLVDLPGSYYAQVTKERRRTRRGRQRCQPDRSRTVTVSQPQFRRVTGNARGYGGLRLP